MAAQPGRELRWRRARRCPAISRWMSRRRCSRRVIADSGSRSTSTGSPVVKLRYHCFSIAGNVVTGQHFLLVISGLAAVYSRQRPCPVTDDFDLILSFLHTGDVEPDADGAGK